APIIEPTRPPRPPQRDVPPSATEAIASSVYVCDRFEVADTVRATRASAPTAENSPPSVYAATRTAETSTPLANAVASFEPTAYRVRRYGISPSRPQTTSGNPSVNTAPGTGPTECARCCTQLVLRYWGFGAIFRSAPMSTKYIDRVATTGGTRSPMIRSPLSMPTPAPMSRTIGTDSAPPRPLGASQMMKISPMK